MNRRTQAQKLKSMIYICGGATAIFSGLCIFQENEKFYENVLLPVVHKFNPEFSHHLAVKANKYNLLPKSPFLDPPQLRTKVWGIDFNNPVGMAAGFDKDGEAVACLHKIGFGFVEIGSVTPKPQPGNNKPRVFRLKANSAIINRYGFNSEGHEIVYQRVKDLKDNGFKGVIGVNLGKNKISADPIQDYVDGIKLFGPVADYLVVNISSPNTPGLRDWQKKEQLEEMLVRLKAARDSLLVKVPLLVKISPDLDDQQCADIASVLLKPQCLVDGIVVSNTSIGRNDELEGPHVNEAGGLSGQPISKTSTAMISQMHKLTQGKLMIIGVGGMFTGKDAYEKIKAGASLVQMYTAFVYHGPPRISKIKQELTDLIKADGYSCIGEAVGKDSELPKTS